MQALSAHTTSPFDLHVLSTPPAFILSQDQTLMFKSLIVKFILNVTSVESEDSLLFVIFKCCLHSEISQRIFRVALLFICQGAFGNHLKYQTEKEGFEPSRRY